MIPGHDNMDDMMSKFREGDGGAFLGIYNLWYKQLCFFAHGIIDNMTEAKDITSNVFTSLYTRHQLFGTLENVKAFLYISVNHRCLDYLRNQKRKQTESLEKHGEIETTEIFVLSKMIHSEIITQIYAEIDRLPGKEKKVIALFYIEGLSVKSIASKLEITPDAVISARRRGVKKLREFIISRNLVPLTGSALICFREIISLFPGKNFNGY